LRRALAQLRERLRREWGDGVAGLLLTLARLPVGAGAAATGLAAGAIVMSTKLKLALAGVMVALAGAWVAGELARGSGRARLKASPPASVDAASVDRVEKPRTESAARGASSRGKRSTRRHRPWTRVASRRSRASCRGRRVRSRAHASNSCGRSAAASSSIRRY